MGCDVMVQVVGGPTALVDDLLAQAMRYEQLWSRFRPDSDISRLNATDGPVQVAPETIALIDAMRIAFTQTQGTFNPTVLPRLLDAGYDKSLAPETAALPAARVKNATMFRSLDGIVMDGTVVTVPAGMTLDAGGIAKGHTADLLVAAALDAGAFGAMAIFGGDVRVSGEAPDGGPWIIGVEDPAVPGKHLEIVRLRDGGIATSGQHKRRFRDGATHHLIDPRTGLSADSDVKAVTVIAGTGTQAEVLTKGAFLQEADEYLDWIPSMNAAALLILTDGSVHQSTNWENYL